MQSPFRSIRQTLLNEGKLVRYLGYAIGEIALIIIGRNPDLAQKALEMESVVENSLNKNQRNTARIAHFEGNLNQFVGPGRVGEVPPLYNLDKLRSSDEFRYTVRAIVRCMRNLESFNEHIAGSLEEFLAVLEEYE